MEKRKATIIFDDDPEGKLDALIEEPEEKERIFVYLDKELAYKVRNYGKQIGRNSGGNSRIVTEALKEYFKSHNL